MNPFAALAEPPRCRPGDVVRAAPQKPRKPRASTRWCQPSQNPWGLSGAECVAVQRTADGDSGEEIGQVLGTSRKAVEAMLARARSKMGARTRSQMAAMWALHAAGAKA